MNLYRYVGNSPLIYVDRFGKEKVLLTIYSWRWKWLFVMDWHSWIEINNNGKIHSYGLWPDRTNKITWEQILWNWIQTDLELGIKRDRYAENIEQISISLNKDQLYALEERIRINRQNNVTWWLMPWDNGVCSTWATDMWNLVADTNHQLSSRSIVWISNPNSLADSIADLRNKIQSSSP